MRALRFSLDGVSSRAWACSGSLPMRDLGYPEGALAIFENVFLSATLSVSLSLPLPLPLGALPRFQLARTKTFGENS